MPVIVCDISSFAYEMPIYVIDNDKMIKTYHSDIEHLPKSIAVIAYENGATDIKLRGPMSYLDPWIEDIKTFYSLNYGNNNINVEVI